MAFAFILLVVKAMRPGGILAGLFNKTAVMVPKEQAGPGVVTKEQVAAPK